MMIDLRNKKIIYFFSIFFFYGCKQSSINDDGADVAGRSYYFNNTGNDVNDGSKAFPYKTIDMLNNLLLHPGDTVYFEGGQRFAGSVLIDSADEGSKNKNILLTSSGVGKAIIDGGGATALTIYKTKFIAVNNLAFAGSGRKTGNTKDGVIINKCSDITIDSIDVKGFQKAGLLVNSCTHSQIKNVYAADNGSVGIFIVGEYATRDCSDILVSNCTAENNPGDPTNLTNHSGNGILAGNCKNVTIEYCAATNNGWDMPRTGNGPVGIWCFEADSVTIQYCISYKNKTSKGGGDGGGFDMDGGVTNSVIQYCLSYENEGAGFGIFQYNGAAKWYNNTVRYCISENDGAVSPAQAGVFIWNSSMDTAQFRDFYFYNNVVYNEKGAAISYEPLSANAGFHFYNNIFVAKDSLIHGKETNSNCLGNNWFSLTGGFLAEGINSFSAWTTIKKKETMQGRVVGYSINPQFKNPGKSAVVLPSLLNKLDNYTLPDNSVLKDGGLNLKELFGIDNGGKLFNQGPAAPKKIGAF